MIIHVKNQLNSGQEIQFCCGNGEYKLAHEKEVTIEIQDEDVLYLDVVSQGAAAENEIRRLKNWVNDLQSGMYVNCVYCGHRYGPTDEVPASMADVLKAHIEQCPEHPMSKLKQELEELKKIVDYPRKEVMDFAVAMENELRENDHKCGWQNCSLEWLVAKLAEETGEVASVVIKDFLDTPHELWREKLIKESADVANIAMMLAEIARKS